MSPTGLSHVDSGTAVMSNVPVQPGVAPVPPNSVHVATVDNGGRRKLTFCMLLEIAIVGDRISTDGTAPVGVDDTTRATIAGNVCPAKLPINSIVRLVFSFVYHHVTRAYGW